MREGFLSDAVGPHFLQHVKICTHISPLLSCYLPPFSLPPFTSLHLPSPPFTSFHLPLSLPLSLPPSPSPPLSPFIPLPPPLSLSLPLPLSLSLSTDHLSSLLLSIKHLYIFRDFDSLSKENVYDNNQLVSIPLPSLSHSSLIAARTCLVSA